MNFQPITTTNFTLLPLKGKVLSSDGSGVEGATVVSVDNPTLYDYTDENGNYEIKNLPLFSKVSVIYQGVTKSFLVKKNNQDFVFESELLDEVVITNKKESSKLWLSLGLGLTVLVGSLVYAANQENKTAKIKL